MGNSSDRIRESLSRTKEQIVERFDEIVRRADAPERRSKAVDVETIDALEELLISADVGVAGHRTHHQSHRKRGTDGKSLRDVVKDEIRDGLCRALCSRRRRHPCQVSR